MRLMAQEPNSAWGDRGMCSVNADGTFVMEGVTLGLPMNLWAEGRGLRGRFDLKDAKPGEAVDAGDIRLKGIIRGITRDTRWDAVVIGRVVDEKGQPLKGARMDTAYSGLQLSGATDDDGRFRLDGLPEIDEPIRVDFRKEGYMSQTLSIKPGTRDVEIRLEPLAEDRPPAATPATREGPVGAAPYDKAEFDRRMAEAAAYEHSATRVRDIAVEKYRAAIAARPDHPENIDIELEIGALLLYRMNPNEEPKSKEARDVYANIVSRYGSKGNDIRVLQAKVHFADLNRMIDGAVALTASREVYGTIIDLPEGDIVIPEHWRVKDGRRMSPNEWQELRTGKIRFVKSGAIGTYLTSYVAAERTPEGRAAVLDRLSALRPGNALYQEHIATLRKSMGIAGKD
jgi:hypothetical protein